MKIPFLVCKIVRNYFLWPKLDTLKGYHKIQSWWKFEGIMQSSKWENLSRCSTKLIHVWDLHWIAGRINILCEYIIYIFFNFGTGFCGSFAMLFPKAPASCCKNVLNKFLLHYASILMSSKSMSQIFKILFQNGNINIFVLHGVFFNRYVQLKCSYSDEKNSGEIWDILS